MRPDVEKLLLENNLEALKNLTYYDLFNIRKDLNTEDLKKEVTAKYHALSLRFHPDRTQSDLVKTDIFKFIQAGYEILLNENSKFAYDFNIGGHANNMAAFFGSRSNSPETTLEELYKRMSDRIAKQKDEEAITERVVIAFLIVGGDYNERETAIELLKTQHIGATEMGMRCVGSNIKEPVETTFSRSSFACYTSSYDYGNNLEKSYSALLLSNDEILRCHQDADFIKRLAKSQKNITTLAIKSSCCVM